MTMFCHHLQLDPLRSGDDNDENIVSDLTNLILQEVPLLDIIAELGIVPGVTLDKVGRNFFLEMNKEFLGK